MSDHWEILRKIDEMIHFAFNSKAEESDINPEKTLEYIYQELQNYGIGWIPVSERLPEGRNQWNSCWWMVIRRGKIPTDAVFYMNTKKWVKESEELSDVTHWQPLPAPPTEEK